MVKEAISSPGSTVTAPNRPPTSMAPASSLKVRASAPAAVTTGASASGATVTVRTCSLVVVWATPSTVATDWDVALTVICMSSALFGGGRIARPSGTTPSAKVMAPSTTSSGTPSTLSTAPSGMPDRVTLRVSVPSATLSAREALIGRATATSSTVLVSTADTSRSGMAAFNRSSTVMVRSPNCRTSTSIRVSLPSRSLPPTLNSPLSLSRLTVNSSKLSSNTAVSVPSPPMIVSSPPPPVSVSSPRPPANTLSPSEPTMMSSPAPPMTFSMLTRVSRSSPTVASPSPRSMYSGESGSRAEKSTVSMPSPPSNRSLPAPPMRISFPASPKMASSPSVPVMTSSPSPA